MEEFVTCEVCVNVYAGDLRCPRMFTCGHSFCSSCIQKMLKANECCPTCKMSIEGKDVESISINYALKHQAERYLSWNTCIPKVKNIDSDLQNQSSSRCKTHSIPKDTKCKTCNLWVCEKCVPTDHKCCTDLLAKDVNEVVRDWRKNTIQKHIEMVPGGEQDSLFLLGYYNNILEVKTDVLDGYKKKINVVIEEIGEVKRKIEKVSLMQQLLTLTKEKLDIEKENTDIPSSLIAVEEVEEKLVKHFNTLKEVVENLKFHKFYILQEAEKESSQIIANKNKLMSAVTSGKKVSITSGEGNITRYGKLDVNEGRLRIHYLQPEPSSKSCLCLTIDQCLTTLTGGNEWPKKVFLQFSSNGVMLGDVIIFLNEEANEASRSILQMCLFGRKGSSFKEMGIGCEKEYVWSGYCLRVPSCIDRESLLQERQKKNWKEGEFALSLRNGKDGMKFQFLICVEGSEKEWQLIPAGEVENGIEVVKDANQRGKRGESIKIFNCGWIVT